MRYREVVARHRIFIFFTMIVSPRSTDDFVGPFASPEADLHIVNKFVRGGEDLIGCRMQRNAMDNIRSYMAADI